MLLMTQRVYWKPDVIPISGPSHLFSEPRALEHLHTLAVEIGNRQVCVEPILMRRTINQKLPTCFIDSEHESSNLMKHSEMFEDCQQWQRAVALIVTFFSFPKVVTLFNSFN